MTGKSDLQEIYRTSAGCVYQSDKNRRLIVEFAGTTAELNVPFFTCLKKMVEKIDVHSMLENPSRAADVEVVAPCGIQNCYVLTVRDVIQFKELLSGAKVMLELNSIIYERLYSIPV
ncbi:hypothetical protein RCC89_18335 [Cytophagaceae bacterium ABcell3]|nr:hypothetical protein RCC89_18335 [Cytophagaceae bacterium ABcell3]